MAEFGDSGAAPVGGSERDQILRSARIDGPLRWRETSGEVTVDGEDSTDGEACRRLTSKPPKPRIGTLWFDKNPRLLLRTAWTLASPMGELPIESRFLNYRDAGGLKIPFKLRQNMAPQVIETVLEEVRVNQDVPPLNLKCQVRFKRC